jgi:hypothetical protein
VIEVEPSLKEQMYAALDNAKPKLTMKAWFTREAQRFCDESVQPSLFSLQTISLALGTKSMKKSPINKKKNAKSHKKR